MSFVQHDLFIPRLHRPTPPQTRKKGPECTARRCSDLFRLYQDCELMPVRQTTRELSQSARRPHSDLFPHTRKCLSELAPFVRRFPCSDLFKREQSLDRGPQLIRRTFTDISRAKERGHGWR